MDAQADGEHEVQQLQSNTSEKEESLTATERKSKNAKTRKPYTITKARERWTDEEHSRFLEGMSLYGRSWGKVASHVQTKTTIQIRSHAQKYFNRIKKQQDSHPAAGQLVNPLDPNRPVIQSWQSPTQQIVPPTEYNIAPTASEPFQRAAEIVAAAATEAAAAAASVVVSAASKKIKEQLESLYSQSGARAGLGQAKPLSSNGPSTTVAQTESLPAVPAALAGQGTPSCLSAFSTPGSEAAAHLPPHIPAAVPQAVLAGNMQSIETKIAFKAMQRIAALFQHAQTPAEAYPASSIGAITTAPASAFAVLPSASGSAFVPLPAAAPQVPAGTAYAEPSGLQPKHSAGAAAPPNDGAFCGDSDVVGDVKEATSGGGTGASQAFSEVGMDPRRDCATPAQRVAGKGPGADDSGSSHASEPLARRSTAHQACNEPHNTAQHGALPANVGAMSQWQPTTLAGMAQVAAGGAIMLPTYALPHMAQMPSESGLTPNGSQAGTQRVPSIKNSASLATQTVDGLSTPPTSAGHASMNHPQSNGLSNGTGSNGGPSNGFISSAHGSYSTIPGTHGMPSAGTALHSGNGSNGQSVHTSPAANVCGTMLNGNHSTAPSGNLSDTQQAARSADRASGDVAQAPSKRGPALVSGLAPAARAMKQAKLSRHEQVAHARSSAALESVGAAVPQAWQQLPLPAGSGANPVQGMYHPSVQQPQSHPVDARQVVATGDAQSMSAHAGAVGTIDGLNHILHAAQLGVQPAVAVPGAVGEVPVLPDTPWWPAAQPLHSTLPGNLHGLVNFMLDTQIATHFQQHAAAVSACDPVGVRGDVSKVVGPSNNT